MSKLTRVAQNLIINSDDFTGAGWTTQTAVVTSGQADPLGGTNAQKVEDNSAVSYLLVGQTGLAIPKDFSTYCIQMLVKKDAASTTAGWFTPVMLGGSTVSSGARFSAAGAVSGGAVMEDLGNGWYLYWALVTNNGTNNSLQALFYPAISLNPGAGDNANNVGSMICYAPQIIRGHRPTDWARGAARLNSGVTTSMPRVRRTQNLAFQSQTFDSVTWTKGNTTVTADNIAAPDGTTTADKITDTVTGGAVAHYVIQTPVFSSTTVGVLLGQVLTYSVYAKVGTKNYVTVGPENAVGQVSFNLTTGAPFTQIATNVVGSSSVNCGNGWWRCSVTYRYTVGQPGWVIYLSNDAANTNYIGDGTGTVYLWGAQITQSNAAGDYVATTTVAGPPSGETSSPAITYPVVAPPQFRTAS